MIRLLCFGESGELRFREFEDGEYPAYAILSHTWYRPSEQELEFQDVLGNTGTEKLGHEKVIFCLSKAAEDGMDYCWVDTCCINKESSAELSRAINSMFRWYSEASRCYVYLSDVSTANSPEGSPATRLVWEPAFRQSRWFTRGWTLQELLAPSEVRFFSKEGTYLGDKISLQPIILEVTNLPAKALPKLSIEGFTCEEKMSWADFRQTSEPEDLVYCLVGILDISMEALYGEGLEKARRRLHEKLGLLGAPSSTVLGKRSRSDFDDEETSFQITKSHRQEGTTLDAEGRAKLLESLKFDQLEARQLSIKKAHAKTCKWLFQDSRYLDWFDESKLVDHHGFLWIKGKPGSGKSTLMKFALADAWKRQKTSDTAILSFFFNARGEVLEKSTPGAYRTLLVQFLEQFPDLTIELGHLASITTRLSENQQWEVETLKELLSQCFHCLGSQKVICFVDALDECDESEIRDMMAYFEDVGERSVPRECRIQICFASRYYPHITIRHGLSLKVDRTEGHRQDIDTYLNHELKIGQGPTADQVRRKLEKRASGVFIWIALVVDILNKEYDSGRIQGLLRRVEEIPGDLHTLFKEILTRDSSNQDAMLLCIQWVLFAERPLTPEQLYFAIRSGLEHAVIERPEPEQMAADAIQRYILNASKGLAEITKTRSKTKSATVQFIHESVRDFLLKQKGVHTLWPGLAQDVELSCHSRLYQCCRPYLDVDLVVFSSQLDDLPKPNSEEGKTLRGSLRTAFPFLEYAITNLFFHLENSADDFTWIDTPSSPLPDTVKKWKRILNGLVRYQTHRYDLDQSSISVFCHRGHIRLVQQALIGMSNLPQIEGLTCVPDLFQAMAMAMECKNEEMIDMLLKALLEMRVRGHWPYEPRIVLRVLQLAFEQQREQIVMILLKEFSHISHTKFINTSLLTAADKGVYDALLFILDHYEAVEDIKQSAALGTAVFRGHFQIVKLLLDRGFDVSATFGVSQKHAITAAAGKGDEDIVKLLLDHGADINQTDNDGTSPLIAAAYGKHWHLVPLILAHGANATDTDSFGLSAMDIAASLSSPPEAALHVLVAHGAIFGAASNWGIEGLLRAVHDCNHKLVKLYLDNGVDVNGRSENERETALISASERGATGIVNLLLERGADVNAAAMLDGRTALHQAAHHALLEVAECLLDHGADIDARDYMGFTAAAVARQNMVACTGSGFAEPFQRIIDILYERGAQKDTKF